jgi:sensor c-di-GMP phosphodiesterase-like protein
LRRRIVSGIKKDRFFCHYQAIVDLRDKKIVACECLARFSDKYGEISPDVFIPLIKQKGLSWQFTEKILKQIQKDISGFILGKDHLRINVNFFPTDIVNGHVEDYLSKVGLNHRNVSLTIEVTEEEDLNFVESEEAFSRLAKAGYKIAIDDFGTGYSNLNKLHLLHCSYLKIDRSFIDKMESGKVLSKLIPHIVNIAESTKAEVVAEGIENEAQVDALLLQGIRFGQGFFFSKPIPFPKFADLVENF